ncbi:MAG: exonuclease SbcCD subunit D [Anaerolineaceae bacterium]
MIKILHFADAHIDMANYGRHDPESGLPLRVLDFLHSLDTIVDAAIAEEVDLVLFAGDAYKDRNPAPTFQREWGKRIMRLSQAGIRTLLLLGNHDTSPALGRAHAIQEYDTLHVPHVRVADKPMFIKSGEFEGLQAQILAIPWLSRSRLMAELDLSAADTTETNRALEERVGELIGVWLEQADPSIPVILTAHASIQGAKYGNERTVMLGADLVLAGSLVKDSRIDYVAMGHIHKPQDVNEGSQPPVVYPGSIERVDFGELEDEKYFVIAKVEKGKTDVEWRKIPGIRQFLEYRIKLKPEDEITPQLEKALPDSNKVKDAVVKVVLEYPEALEARIDETWLRHWAEGSFEFHLRKNPQFESRVRIPSDESVSSMGPMELLDIYWREMHTPEDQLPRLQKLAEDIISGEEEGGEED